MSYPSAKAPTLYFIGVTTTQSSIMRVFPEWVRFLGLGDAVIKGMDFPIHADPEAYIKAVAFIKNDPLCMGALVTTHKLDLYDACKDLFEVVDSHAELMTEVSCISKQGDQLVCGAKDPISAGLSIDGFLPDQFFRRSGGALFCMGAGGSAIAITWHLQQELRGRDNPSYMVISDRLQSRLDHIKQYHRRVGVDIPVDYVLIDSAADNDRILANLPPHSFVINATGLGKDTPGSPVSDRADFPEHSVVWDLNYRGELVFLDQALAQQEARSLQVENGWTYFIHGWTQAIAEVFHITIPTIGVEFDRLSEIAASSGKPG